MSKSKQLALALPFRGGKRPGAGRKPSGARALVSHAARPKFLRPMPVHVTLKVVENVPSLRAARRFAKIRECFAAARGRFGLRLVEFNVLGNHLHLVVEADHNRALSRGMHGLAIRLAKALNAMAGRRGSVFADHYHSRLLTTPTELVRAIRYVIENDAHHYGAADASFSSRAPDALPLLAAPIGWHLRVGWQRTSGSPISPAALLASG